MTAPTPALPAPAGIEVTAPPVVPFRYGLLSVATFETPPARPNANAWEAHGVVYAGDSCGPQGGIWPSPCAPGGGPADPPADPKSIQDGLEFSQGVPFTIYESARCLAMGFPDADGKARRRLALHEQHWVETWADANAFTGARQLAGGAATPLVRAWALLEDEIADVYGGLGVIHVPRWAYGALPERRLIERDAARYRTPLDNLVAIGAGYSGNSPAGAAPAADQVWLYATGPVKAFRSEVFSRESFDQQRNTRTAVAERVYALTFDCLRVGVLAQL